MEFGDPKPPIRPYFEVCGPAGSSLGSAVPYAHRQITLFDPFLGAGLNVISAANGTLSIDYYIRDGGDGMCTLP